VKPTGNGAHAAQKKQMELVKKYEKLAEAKMDTLTPSASSLAPREPGSSASRSIPAPPSGFTKVEKKPCPRGSKVHGRAEANGSIHRKQVRHIF
jgi:hypothetical protein